jgi:hypothetical protein
MMSLQYERPSLIPHSEIWHWDLPQLISGGVPDGRKVVI